MIRQLWAVWRTGRSTCVARGSRVLGALRSRTRTDAPFSIRGASSVVATTTEPPYVRSAHTSGLDPLPKAALIASLPSACYQFSSSLSFLPLCCFCSSKMPPLLALQELSSCHVSLGLHRRPSRMPMDGFGINTEYMMHAQAVKCSREARAAAVFPRCQLIIHLMDGFGPLVPPIVQSFKSLRARNSAIRWRHEVRRFHPMSTV